MTPAQMATFQRVEGILRGASHPVPGAPAQSLEAAARPALAEVERELRRMGLVMGPAQIANVRAVPTLIVLAAGVPGGVRLPRGMVPGPAGGLLDRTAGRHRDTGSSLRPASEPAHSAGSACTATSPPDQCGLAQQCGGGGRHAGRRGPGPGRGAVGPRSADRQPTRQPADGPEAKHGKRVRRHRGL